MHLKSKTSMKMKLKLRSRAKAKAKAKPLAHSTERVIRKRDVFCKILQFFRKFKRSTGKASFVPEIVFAQHAPLVEELVEIDLPFTTLNYDAYLDYTNELLVRKSPESLDAQESIQVLHFSGLFANATPETSVATLETPLIVEIAKKAVPIDDVGPSEVSPTHISEESAETRECSLSIEQSDAHMEDLELVEAISDQTSKAYEEFIQSSDISITERVSESVPVEIDDQLEVSTLKGEAEKIPVEIIEHLEVSLVQTPLEPEEALKSSEVSPLKEEPEKVPVEAYKPIEIPLECEHEFILLAPVQTFERLIESLKKRPKLCLLAPIEVVERSALSSGQDHDFEATLESPEGAKVAELSTDILVQKWHSCVEEAKEDAESANGAIKGSHDSTILDSHIVSSTTFLNTNVTVGNGNYSQQILEQSTDVERPCEGISSEFQGLYVEEAANERGSALAYSVDAESIFLSFEGVEPKDNESKPKESKKKNRKRKGKSRGKRKNKNGGNGNGNSSDAHVSLETQVKKPDVATPLEKPKKVEADTKVPEVEAEVSEDEVRVPEVDSEAVSELGIYVPVIEVGVVVDVVPDVEPEVITEVITEAHTVPDDISEIEVKVIEVVVKVIPEVVPEVVSEIVPDVHIVPEVPEIVVASVKTKGKAPEAKATNALIPKPSTIKAPVQAYPIQVKRMFDEGAAENASREVNQLVTSSKRKRYNASSTRTSNNFSSQAALNHRAYKPIRENRKFMKQPQVKESQVVIDHKKQAALLPEFTPFEHPEDKKFFNFSTLQTGREFLAKTNFSWADDPTTEDLI